MQNAIEVKNMTKVYKDGYKALNGLNITVRKGEIYSFLGKNGSGKSTLINILTTFLKPTSGDVTILGKSLIHDKNFIRSKLSCVAQKNSIDGYMTLYENMQFQGKLYHVSAEELSNRIDDLIGAFHLDEYRNKKVSDCSGGVQRKLDIAMSMTSIPEILFLDEPTTGMDIESRLDMWSLVQTINKKYGTTIFLTTHFLEEAEALSDRICIMGDGREMVVGTIDELRKYIRQNLVKIYLSDGNFANKKRIMKELKQLSFIKNKRENGEELILEVLDTQEDYLSILEFGLKNRMSFYKAEIVQPTLDDIFLKFFNDEENSYE